MSLRQHRKLPFVKHKDLPDHFILLPTGYGEGRYGLFIKGTILEEDEVKDLIQKEWENGINISLTGPSIDWLIDEGFDVMDDIIKEGADALCIEFLKDSKGHAHITDMEKTDIILSNMRAKKKKEKKA